ncbi:DUF3750 domain-containing protein [Halomonas sp. GXIMD04776]|uniref:DUF3750 domain-containing protein n=1 Tax=Halomonas sp. GXIMD04776 TaxID=3415605 RepID=UPI003C9D9A69
MKQKSRYLLKGLGLVGIALVLLLAGPVLMLASPQVDLDGHWATADRSPVGLAPAPDQVFEAVVQVYAVRAFKWRGAFGVHTWIATKAEGASSYVLHEVTRWYSSTSMVSRSPDRAWFGNSPWLLADYRGDIATRMIPRISAAAADYPFAEDYAIWPGPNSNTFTAWVVREVPELRVHLPPTAVGKDFLSMGFFAPVPSGSGYQLSFGGAFGVLIALEEGIEFNLLGLTLGVDLAHPALKLPGIGRLGLDQPVSGNAVVQ